MRLMHKEFRQWWLDFVQWIPESWDPNGFFKQHMPFILSCRYGQNMAIGVDNNAQRELQGWTENRTWARIHQVTISIATNIS